MRELSAEIRDKIKGYSEKFRRYMETEDYKQDEKEREERKEIFKILDRDNIDGLEELEVRQLVSSLWATGFFGNKEYVVNKILQENGLDKIKTQLKNLLWGSDSLASRYNKFTIKGLGPASVTEILTFVFPKECGIWNDKARKALKILGFSENELPLDKYQITGEEYVKFNRVLRLIADELEQNTGLKEVDLIEVDYFLYVVYMDKKKGHDVEHEFDHDEIRDKIFNIGNSLGFEVEKELNIAKGSRVDVVWRAKIANLGVVTYVFEVHKRGSIDSLILNLQRAKNNPTVQKLVAVSDKKHLEDIAKEAGTLPEDFRKALTYFDVGDVDEMWDSLEKVGKILSKLELVKSDFGG